MVAATRLLFSIEFLRNGGNVFELKKILGHEKLETVEVYLELASVEHPTSATSKQSG